MNPAASESEQLQPEEPLRFLQPVCEHVDFVLSVVDVEAGPGRRRDIEDSHERTCAVMPGANTDAVLVEDRLEIVRVDVAECEADGAAADIRVEGAVDRQAVDGGQPFEGVSGDLDLVLADFLHADRREVVDSRSEPDGFGDGWCAGFELLRDVGHVDS